jgi:gamma-glutamyl:cysteine ligase YbdK (ATP-grasp superfamily)
MLDRLVESCGPHADALGCADELARVRELAACTGAQRQVALAEEKLRLPGVVEQLADEFTA